MCMVTTFSGRQGARDARGRALRPVLRVGSGPPDQRVAALHDPAARGLHREAEERLRLAERTAAAEEAVREVRRVEAVMAAVARALATRVAAARALAGRGLAATAKAGRGLAVAGRARVAEAEARVAQAAVPVVQRA